MDWTLCNVAHAAGHPIAGGIDFLGVETSSMRTAFRIAKWTRVLPIAGYRTPGAEEMQGVGGGWLRPGGNGTFRQIAMIIITQPLIAASETASE